MRLIDADAIPYREIWREDWLHNAGKYQQGVFRDEIEEMPAVDAVPVIRCKDCVHWEKNNWNPNGMCNAFDDGSVCILTETDADEYCARAERKEE